jgi:phage tail-like protein
MAADKQADINKNYPITAFRYMAKIGDAEIAFSEISGLNIGYEASEYKEATANGVVTTQVVGQRDVPTITMKRGLFEKSLELYDWLNGMHTDDFTKKDIIISLLNNTNNAVMTWTIANAFPMKFEGPSLDAKSNDISFQSLEVKGDSLLIANA